MTDSPAGGGDVAGGSIKPGATAAIFLRGRGRAGTSYPGAVAVHSTGTHHSIMITPTAPPMAQAGLSGGAVFRQLGAGVRGTAVARRGLLSGERARGEAYGGAGLRTGGAISGPGCRFAPE